MGVFTRFEKRVEAVISGTFARAFKGDVQPVEIAARLQRELDAEAKLLSRDKRLVPNDFTVGLSQHDHDKLVPYASTLTRELGEELRRHARDVGYVFNGPIRIDLELNSRLPTGRFTVASEAVAEVLSVPPPTTADERPGPHHGAGPGRLVLEVNGTRHPLTSPGLVIGRGTDADLRINDPGISRRHAEIRVQGGHEDGIDIVDLGSTNGITVNGQRVRHARLEEGSRIEIGSTRMLVHDPGRR